MRPQARLFLFWGAVLTAAAFGVLLFFGRFRPFAIVGPSMLPTLRPGDRVVVRLLSPQKPLPPRDSLVLISHAGRWAVKRLAGLPGDHLEVRAGRLWINGQPSGRAHQARRHPSWYPPQGRIPPGSVFLLGDHQSHSADSRSWGCLPRETVIGQVTLRYWPLSHLGTPS